MKKQVLAGSGDEVLSSTVQDSILNTLFQNSVTGLTLVSLTGQFLKVNSHAYEIFQLTEGELASSTLPEIINSGSQNHDREFFNKLVSGEYDTYNVENLFFKQLIVEIWINLLVSTIKDEENQPLYFLVQIENISEKKRLAMQLVENEEKLQLFVEHSPLALAIFDNEMRYMAISQRWMIDYKLEGRQLTGQHHYNVFPNLQQKWKDAHSLGLKGETLLKKSNHWRTI